MRVPNFILAFLAATIGVGTANAASLSYTLSTCASFSCTTASDTILSFTTGAAITAPADPGPAADPGGTNVTAAVPLSGLSAVAGSFTGATIKTYHFQSHVGSALDFAGFIAADGFTYPFGGFPVEIGSSISSATDLPLSIGIGSYNGLALTQCLDAVCDAQNPGGVPVLLTVAQTNSSAMPEPATWAMFIGGFSFIGHAMRRRERVRISLS